MNITFKQTIIKGILKRRFVEENIETDIVPNVGDYVKIGNIEGNVDYINIDYNFIVNSSINAPYFHIIASVRYNIAIYSFFKKFSIKNTFKYRLSKFYLHCSRLPLTVLQSAL